MADLSITAANVVPGSGSPDIDKTKVYGESVSAGDLVAVSSGKYVLADCTDDDLNAVEGIAVNSGAANQPAAVLRKGAITLGSVLTVGEIYVASEGGAIAPVGDLTSGDYVSVIGVATTATSLQVDINNSGVKVPAA